MKETLTPRQQREREYHQEYAARRAEVAEKPVSLAVVKDSKRLWWNAYWATYTTVCSMPMKNKRVLVPGCGFGDDAIRLAALGAEVYTFDLSPDVIDIAKQRAEKVPDLRIRFDVMPAEALIYRDDFFDLVLLVDILHHVDIPAAMTEIARVLKPDGIIVGDELYTHSLLQRVRESALVRRILYPLMRGFIYGTEKPYITDDEHKINEVEFTVVRDRLIDSRIRYFNFLVGRIVPAGNTLIMMLDRLLVAATCRAGRFLAGRVVFTGTIKK